MREPVTATVQLGVALSCEWLFHGNSSSSYAVCILWNPTGLQPYLLPGALWTLVCMQSVCYWSVYLSQPIHKMKRLVWLTVAEVSGVRCIPTGACVRQNCLPHGSQGDPISLPGSIALVFLPLFVVGLVSIMLYCFETRAHCSPGCPETCYVDQAGLRFTEISLPLCTTQHSAAGFIFESVLVDRKGLALYSWLVLFLSF